MLTNKSNRGLERTGQVAGCCAGGGVAEVRSKGDIERVVKIGTSLITASNDYLTHITRTLKGRAIRLIHVRTIDRLAKILECYYTTSARIRGIAIKKIILEERVELNLSGNIYSAIVVVCSIRYELIKAMPRTIKDSLGGHYEVTSWGTYRAKKRRHYIRNPGFFK
jgi:hypothetical protein